MNGKLLGTNATKANLLVFDCFLRGCVAFRFQVAPAIVQGIVLLHGVQSEDRRPTGTGAGVTLRMPVCGEKSWVTKV